MHKIPNQPRSPYFLLSLGIVLCFSTLLVMHCACAEDESSQLRAEYARLRNVDPTTDDPGSRDAWHELAQRMVAYARQASGRDTTSLSVSVSAAELLMRLWRVEHDDVLAREALNLITPVVTAGEDSPWIGDALILRGDLALALDEGTPIAQNWYKEAVALGGIDAGIAEQRLQGLRNRTFTSLIPAHELEVPVIVPGRGTEPSTVRATVVIDPGHGGDDAGAIGIGEQREKDVTLRVAQLVRERLERDHNLRVVLTRDKDVFVPLARRTALANKQNAALFVSLHNNASPSHGLHGLETYYLDNTEDQASRKLAERENGIVAGGAVDDLSFILSDLIQTGKLADSIRLARILDESIARNVIAKYSDLHSLGVKRAPFFVLVGAHMPCSLVEMFFIDHQVEGRRLASTKFQSEMADALARGIVRFLDGGDPTPRKDTVRTTPKNKPVAKSKGRKLKR